MLGSAMWRDWVLLASGWTAAGGGWGEGRAPLPVGRRPTEKSPSRVPGSLPCDVQDGAVLAHHNAEGCPGVPASAASPHWGPRVSTMLHAGPMGGACRSCRVSASRVFMLPCGGLDRFFS